jgi:hypothetical protein
MKHMDYAEYVGEDPTALTHHRWNRDRRRATLQEREGEREDVNDGEAMAMRVVAGG